MQFANDGITRTLYYDNLFFNNSMICNMCMDTVICMKDETINKPVIPLENSILIISKNNLRYELCTPEYNLYFNTYIHIFDEPFNLDNYAMFYLLNFDGTNIKTNREFIDEISIKYNGALYNKIKLHIKPCDIYIFDLGFYNYPYEVGILNYMFVPDFVTYDEVNNCRMSATPLIEGNLTLYSGAQPDNYTFKASNAYVILYVNPSLFKLTKVTNNIEIDWGGYNINYINLYQGDYLPNFGYLLIVYRTIIVNMKNEVLENMCIADLCFDDYKYNY